MGVLYGFSVCTPRLHVPTCICGGTLTRVRAYPGLAVVSVRAFEGEAGFILPALLFRWRSRADPWPFHRSRHGKPRGERAARAYLWMDSLLTFGRIALSPSSLPPAFLLYPQPFCRVLRLSTRLSQPFGRSFDTVSLVLCGHGGAIRASSLNFSLIMHERRSLIRFRPRPSLPGPFEVFVPLSPV